MGEPRKRLGATLERVAFKTSRLAEFSGRRELVTQTGHTIEDCISPTRGAQGNALKTLVAMPFALDGKTGTTMIGMWDSAIIL